MPKLQQTIERGLDHGVDPYRAASLAMDVGKGIGYFSTNVQVDTNVAITFAWGPVQENGDVIDITSEEVNKSGDET